MTNKTAALLQKLRCARFRDEDVTLSRAELLLLLPMLPQPREHDRTLAIRDRAIATLFTLYKANGMNTKAAANAVQDHYKVKRSTILEAWRQHPMVHFLKDCSAEKRAELIARFEVQSWMVDIHHSF
jgi:hypothetical protein